jgi:hypothetical protein
MWIKNNTKSVLKFVLKQMINKPFESCIMLNPCKSLHTLQTSLTNYKTSFKQLHMWKAQIKSCRKVIKCLWRNTLQFPHNTQFIRPFTRATNHHTHCLSNSKNITHASLKQNMCPSSKKLRTAVFSQAHLKHKNTNTIVLNVW